MNNTKLSRLDNLQLYRAVIMGLVANPYLCRYEQTNQKQIIEIDTD